MREHCYRRDSQGLLQAMSAETIPADPDSIVQVVSYATAPFGAQEYNSPFLRLGRKELAMWLSWKKGKLHLISLCLLEGLSLFMFLAKDLL